MPCENNENRTRERKEKKKKEKKVSTNTAYMSDFIYCSTIWYATEVLYL